MKTPRTLHSKFHKQISIESNWPTIFKHVGGTSPNLQWLQLQRFSRNVPSSIILRPSFQLSFSAYFPNSVLLNTGQSESSQGSLVPRFKIVIYFNSLNAMRSLSCRFYVTPTFPFSGRALYTEDNSDSQEDNSCFR